MILETIVATCDREGRPHIAPMGIHVHGEELAILPFRPSRTLDNLEATGVAVINATDDVRVFAGCLTGQGDWPLVPADQVPCPRLRDALAHTEAEVVRIEADETRPKVFCRPLHEAVHAPFRGFNRAQHAVIEAAILVSRRHLLPRQKIEAELALHQRALDKTAGVRERQAWEWLMEALA